MPLITGTVQDEAEALYVGTVYFENLSAPCSAGGRVTGPALHAVQIVTAGAIPTGTRIAPGRTRVVINGRKSKPFDVPPGEGTYDLDTLMTATSLHTRVIVDALTIAELRTYRSATNNFRANVIDDNGAYSVFAWDADATAADDGTDNIRPDDYATALLGLWVRIL